MSVKCRAYPTAAAAARMQGFVDHERFLINLSVEQYDFAHRYRAYAAHPHEAVRSRQHWPTNAERMRQLTELRQELDWLKDGCQAAQQQAIRLVDRAFQNWFKNPSHFRRPAFHAKSHKQGFGIAGAKNFSIRRLNRKWGEVYVPKTGWVRFRLTVPWERVNQARSYRFTLDRCGRWHVSFPGPQPDVVREPTGAMAGIDRGVANTLSTSDAVMDHAPTLTAKEQERVLRLERRLAREKNGSKRRRRTQSQKARIIARLIDRRRAWIEESTTYLVRSYDVIVVEHLMIANMTRSAKGTAQDPGSNVAAKAALNREILAQCWGLWLQRLKEKAATCGVLVIEVPAHNTSLTCNSCGYKSKDNRESQAVFVCKSCGYERHADTNAALNILDRGVEKLGLADGHAVTAHGASSLDGAVKCEAPRAA